MPLLAPRVRNSHKGDYGHVLVVAGSRGMTGAAVLAARAALKAGAGLVTMACPATERQLVALALPEAMTFSAASSNGCFSLKAAGQVAGLARDKKADIVLIGPGLSTWGETPAFVIKLLSALQLPAVVDADALNAVAIAGRYPQTGLPGIITPHPGEARRLLAAAVSDRPASVAALARMCAGAAVLKGAGTLVSDGVSVLENTTGGPALAKGGSGDVLAGFCAGFFVQAGLRRGFSLKTAFESASLAVYLHGLCGDLAAVKFTERGVLASELIDALPRAMRRMGART
ncbi:MAG: NAD(P)H-hydrate dehydratase [Elusimicrobia bacterium RIFOXYA12_FULL_57_11]|nr:MAG: NAD(P)H-hydrate dehydratase [Elusimicrobia bacterium RIFOXYA12_FULL_57_11]